MCILWLYYFICVASLHGLAIYLLLQLVSLHYWDALFNCTV